MSHQSNYFQHATGYIRPTWFCPDSLTFLVTASSRLFLTNFSITMVLLDRYMNRNVSNTENLPPTVRAFTKRGTPTLRSNVHCRRVSASAFARTQYLQAQKLTHAAKVKVRRVARYSITVPVATPEPKTSTASPTTVPVTLPRVLPRQPFQEIPLSALAQFGAHSNVEYLRDSLPEFSSS